MTWPYLTSIALTLSPIMHRVFLSIQRNNLAFVISSFILKLSSTIENSIKHCLKSGIQILFGWSETIYNWFEFEYAGMFLQFIIFLAVGKIHCISLHILFKITCLFCFDLTDLNLVLEIMKTLGKPYKFYETDWFTVWCPESVEYTQSMKLVILTDFAATQFWSVCSKKLSL